MKTVLAIIALSLSASAANLSQEPALSGFSWHLRRPGATP